MSEPHVSSPRGSPQFPLTIDATPKIPAKFLDHYIFPPSPPDLDHFQPCTHVDEESSYTAAPYRTSILPDEEPVIAVIGVGYVGTHLVETFSTQFLVLGFDVSEKRVKEARAEFASNQRTIFSSDARDLVGATHFLVAVPTLLLDDKSVDTSYLHSALGMVATHARPGATVVIESSVAVGMTRALLGPVAVAKGFFAGMSPERVDPGRIEPPCQAIPKVISGLDDIIPGSLSAISRVYSSVFERIVPVTRPEVAEMTKLYENCQRMMCIAYANEMANACEPLGIDPYEVCEAAATKPFGYMPYSPGIGVGGHCIPVNPYYLLSTCDFPLLKAATEAMWNRPAALAQQILASLVDGNNKMSRLPRILVVGVGFKRGQAVLSYSPGIKLLNSLVESNAADVMFSDALVSQEAVPHVRRLADNEWTEDVLDSFDLVVVATKQIGHDFNVLERLSRSKVQWWSR